VHHLVQIVCVAQLQQQQNACTCSSLLSPAVVCCTMHVFVRLRGVQLQQCLKLGQLTARQPKHDTPEGC